ncbi:MAG: TonB-dependent receptor [Lysobacterales bacterium]
MKFNRNLLSEAVRFGLVAGAFGWAGFNSAPAVAQDSTDTPDADATELNRVVVVGSRIRKVDAETSAPVFTLDRADIEAQGLTSIGDVIQNLTANGTALNTTFNNGGNGETRVSLRNLGSNRTLVLVNGRRWIGGTGLGGAVDLNTIPTAAVERIEVLKDGASTLYGSDAIAGVINIILRTEFQGAEADMFLGQFDEGDGDRQSYSFTVGSTSDRSSVMFGAQYVKEDAVMAGDRAISAEPLIGTGVTFGSSTSPFGRFQVCADPTVTNPQDCAPADRVRPDGSAGQFTFDPGQSGTNWRPFNIPGDFFNFAPQNFLLTPQERTSIFSSGTFDITDNIRFTATGTYNNRKSSQLLAAMPIVLGTGPGAGAQARTIQIDANNFYNPFGAPVVRIQRRAVETGGRIFEQDVNTFLFTGALEGDFQLGDRYFYWDAGWTYGRNDQNDSTDGLFNVLALRQALGPSMLIGGAPRCVTEAGNAATEIDGCVPLNLLGADGSITPEMLAFSSFQAHDQLDSELTDYFANISGDIIELPGGTAAFALGLEHRRESGSDRPDALISSGNTTGNARTSTNGVTTVDEGYLELSLPVLKDLAFAKELSFSLATRVSDYDAFGSTTNSKFGFKYKPIDDLLIRGNWAEGFRAPSIAEQFSGVSDSFPSLADPCNNVRFANLSPAEQQACVAQGVPQGGYDQGNPQIRIRVGGNPFLGPEESISRTLGFVYSPSYVKGFDMAVDWWQIHLRDGIQTIGSQRILDLCVTSLNADPVCQLFSRASDGSIADLLDGPVNASTIDTEGLDLTFNYALPDTRFGSFSFTLDNTYLIDVDDPFGTEVGVNTTNNNNWRIRSNLTARWEMGDFGATWFARYFSHQTEDCQFAVDYGFPELCSDPEHVGVGGVVNAENRIGATTYHDVSAFWNTPWDGKITFGVNNLFDKDPPISVQAFANSFDPQYEVPGRFYYVRYNQKF